VTKDYLRDFSTDARVLILIGLAVVIGAAGTGAAVALFWLIHLVTRIAYGSAAPSGTHWGFWAALVPVAGGLVIGLMARYGSEKIRGHGIPEAIEAILIGESRIKAKVAVLKPVSSAISIGTGGPFGAEGPIIMTGGALGSLIAQLFDLSAAERKTLLVAGAAAGMAATFGTPVAAVLIAVELLLFEWKPRSVVPVAAAAAVAAMLRTFAFETGPLFPFAQHWALPWWGLLPCLLVGVSAGLASGALTGLVYGFEDLFQRLPIHWMWWPAIGGLIVGLGGLIEPRALGVGYDVIRDLLADHMTLGLIAGLVLVKALIWSCALGSGTSGGVLAPLVIMGGALGAIEGSIIPVGTPGFWAMIGMGAMMGGTMRSPLTALVFMVELTHDVDALLPLLVACIAAYAMTVLLLKRSILTEKLARRGQHVMREYVVDPFEITRVADIMVATPETLPAHMPVEEAVAFFSSEGAKRHKSYPIVDQDNRVVGLMSRSDALRWLVQGWARDAAIGELIGDQAIVLGYPDELAGQLADRMAGANAGRVPIVSRGGETLVGIVARRDLLRARARMIAQERLQPLPAAVPAARRRAVA
jgi:H+/Cl- antiporter ClcA